MLRHFPAALLLLSLQFPACQPAPDPLAFRAAAASYPITPDIGEIYSDENNNNRWDPNEPFDDANGNGAFDALWMANDIRRPALSVHDPLYVSAVVFEQGGKRIGMISIDSFGHGFHELERIRQHRDYPGLGLDLLIMGSTHTHEGPDTVGLYGPSRTESGVLEPYMEYIRNQAIEALISSVASLEPAIMESSMIHTGLDTYQVDQRDPIILDDRLSVIRFRSSRTHHVLATVINWASHPEQVINGTAISADYVGAWRDEQEQLHDQTVSLFFQGPLGGQVGSNNISFTYDDFTYEACGECSFEKADALGAVLSNLTEEALENATSDTSPNLDLNASSVLLPLENVGFQHAFNLGLIDRDLVDAAGNSIDRPLEIGTTEAFLRSEMAYVKLGNVSLLTVPGELHPELAIGGYDGSATPGGAENLWSADNEGIESLSDAPPPPYLRDLLDTEVTMILAVSQDFVGYIMPTFNFQLHPSSPYVDSHDWNHHYEETNSLGPGVTSVVNETARRLVAD